ncbi:hypothetical protein TpMuguga_04g00121 [Theileria parva strain Muguga]|uniref:Uncharacterized protein n=1 Tax=Theileria parva TaxID=5875 RepID=Q4N366_THEPA|nr:uncharacterized protein TpMuguga_04g00121 [Theileria parva strain Muguga]EAN31473.1 hypothetical protein TpMuguga_04g00121 [Theileria parva strain Muguga]|eukprot:XP_763756.1 hypothetical protein [Theileria parva strain Muguga]
MVRSGINVFGKQWWGRSHLRIGSRTQPRPNKGFKLSTLKSVPKTVEYFRWWKRIRRGNLAFVINSLHNDPNHILLSSDIAKFERGEANLSKPHLNTIFKYLGITNSTKHTKKFI